MVLTFNVQQINYDAYIPNISFPNKTALSRDENVGPYSEYLDLFALVVFHVTFLG